MTLPEFLGLLGGVLLAIAAPVAALWMGYGALVACLAFPVGFLAGWVLGVVATPLVMSLSARSARAELNRGQASADASDDEA